jgi:hypothetical protein
MPRPVKPRTVGEHLMVLTRIMRQLEVDSKLSPKRAQAVKRHLSAAMAELQAELVGRR